MFSTDIIDAPDILAPGVIIVRIVLWPYPLLWWKVPTGVRFCTVKTEGPADTDVGCILLCPRNSEADFALELVRKVTIRSFCRLF